jgi:NADH-quinone oxidoreductase subunit N
VESNEAGLKYLLLGAFSAGFFLFGIALLYGSTGTTSYSGIAAAMAGGGELSRLLTLSGFGLLLVGFAFKVALVPFHMYAPDVYDGAPTSITAFISTGPKLAGFGALLKLTAVIFGVALASWWGIIWALAALSMTVGNLSALRQENIKRMLAFSSVAHAGYLAMAILVTNFDSGMGMIFYLVVYGVTTLTAFGIASLLEDDSGRPASMDSFRGLARRNPYLAAMFALVMLSLAGIPPTAGFVGKFFIFNAVLEDGYIWLVVIAVMNSLVSVYYYLRPVVAMYMEHPDVEDLIETPWPMIPVLLLFAIIALGLGLFPATLVQSSTAAVSAIL